VNLANGKETTLVAPSRNLQGFNVVGNRVNAVNKGKLSTKALSATAAAEAPVASISRGALLVTVNGVTRNISPQGTAGQSYLWPSVSPDGKKVLYYLVGAGAYVCNLDGSNAVKVGSVRAAQWYDNNVIVGMQDQDNGEVVTASKLVAVNAAGTIKQDLTQVSSMAMYPSVAGNGAKISFVTPAGELFIMNVNK
jgi:Tol biopolymer transport system component